MTFGLITHPDCLKHSVPDGHPENAQRIHAVQNGLMKAGLDLFMPHSEAPLASKEHLLSVHDASYVNRILALADAQSTQWLDDDTWFGPDSLDAALRAAGSGLLAVDKVMEQPSTHQFCLVRPPGHHANRHSASGFCVFNNVALAAQHTLEQHDLSRIAIIDFDAHHGNGTEDIVHNDERILFCSLFQHPFYPNYPFRQDHPKVLNAPLDAYTDGNAVRRLFDEHWLPALNDFKPELVLVSAGFDAHRKDELSNLAFTEDDYSWMSRKIIELAKRHASGRLVALLEGGYELPALTASVIAFIRAEWA